MDANFVQEVLNFKTPDIELYFVFYLEMKLLRIKFYL